MRNGERRELAVESSWPHLGLYILKFQHIDSISEAEALVGCELQIPAQDRAPLGSGEIYVNDLIGTTVWAQEGSGPSINLGVLVEVQFGAGEAPLLIVKTDSKEYLLPFAAEYVESMDATAKTIYMRLPGGMLELDSPLTAEEKRDQAVGDPGKRKAHARK